MRAFCYNGFLQNLGFFGAAMDLLTSYRGGYAPIILLLLGPPGAGKGTHALALSKKLGLPHISTGDLFRESVKEGTSSGKKAQEFIKLGKLVPDALVLDLLFSRIERQDCKGGIILDGFPRTLGQAEALYKRLSLQKVVALHFDIPREFLVERIVGRLTCSFCKACFHKKHIPPQKEGICDCCKSALYQREDDQEEIFKKRLQIYEDQSRPLLNFYREKENLYKIDAAGAKQAVIEEIFKTMDLLLPAKKEAAIL